MPDGSIGGSGMGYGAIANFAGNIMQSIAASQEAKAMAKEFGKELKRQRGYQTEALGLFNPALGKQGVEQAKLDMSAAQAGRQQDYAQTQNIPVSVGGAYAPTARDQASAQMTGGLRATNASYGDWMRMQKIRQDRLQEGLNRVSNFSQGTQQVYPYRLYDAQHSMDELAFWGQLISSLGGGSMNLATSFQGSEGMPHGGLGGGIGGGGFAASVPSNFSELPRDAQASYLAQYQRYNDPRSPYYVPPGTYE